MSINVDPLNARDHCICVLSIAFPFAPVAGDSVGGAEQIVYQLDRAIEAGFGQSIVIAREDSSVSGTLIPIPIVHGKITTEKQIAIWDICRRSIEDTLCRYPVDVVHLHGIDFFRYIPANQIPKLVTLHLPLSWYPSDALCWSLADRVYLHCVSESQARLTKTNLLPPIENGVLIPTKPPDESKSDYVLALGRICPEKGFHCALDAAKIASVAMFLAGATFDYEAHQRYFNEEILPRLDNERKFIGPVGPDQKRTLISRARCVLIPSFAPETSSLVAMEALAYGTPVIAFPNGALPEIVEHGSTGFIVKSTEEMAEAIGLAHTISPRVCWETARARFSSERMIARYLECYRSLLSQPNKANPQLEQPIVP